MGAEKDRRTALESPGEAAEQVADIGADPLACAVLFDIEPQPGQLGDHAIADLRLGRLDEETTANVGTISGGSARNIVPEWCELQAEARSHDERKLADLVQEMLDTFAFAGSVSECTVETEVSETYPGYRFQESDSIVQLARTALERCGYEFVPTLTGGGADANVFNMRGVPCLNLANGMREIHTADEHIAVADLDAMVDVTLALVDAARNAAQP